MYNYGKARSKILHKHPQSLTLLYFLLQIGIPVFIGLLGYSYVFSKPLFIITMFSFQLYLIVCMFASVSMVDEWYDLSFLFIFPMIHFSYMFGMTMGWFKKGDTT